MTTPLNDDDREALTAYLDGELDEESTQVLEARLGRELEAPRGRYGPTAADLRAYDEFMAGYRP